MLLLPAPKPMLLLPAPDPKYKISLISPYGDPVKMQQDLHNTWLKAFAMMFGVKFD